MFSNNTYISEIINTAIDNKYTKWYINIIENALSRTSSKLEAKTLLGYIEGHHIIPKSFNKKWEKEPNNIVYLSGREHFVCHWLLTKMFYDKRKITQMNMCLAAFMLNSTGNRILTSHQYAVARKSHNLAIQMLVDNGLHYFQSETSRNKTKEWIKEKMQSGTHHMQQDAYKELFRSINLKRIEDGTHHFQNKEFIEQNAKVISERNKQLAKEGNHIFQNPEIKKKAIESTKKSQEKLLKEGNHTFQTEENKLMRLERNKNDNPVKKMFFSIIETKKTYSKAHLSTWFPEFKKFY